MSEPVSPLDPRLLDVLRAERPAPSDVRTRVRAKLEAAIPEMRRTPGGSSNGDGTDGGVGTGRGGFGSRMMGIAAFIAGGITGAALFAALSKTPSAKIIYVERSSSETTTAAGTPILNGTTMVRATVTHPAMAPAPPEPDSVSSPTDANAATTRSPHPSHRSRLMEERILLDEARAGLVQGAPDRALERLQRHRARFADGLLAEERDAMQIEALVRAGRYDEARGRASAFRVRLPGSLFLPTVESAVASIP